MSVVDRIVFGVAFAVMALAYLSERYRARRRFHHSDPCLHEQGMAGHKTWKPADPALFKGRAGKALEWHLGGIAWYLATQPERDHRCKPQTCGITETLQHYDRCACGATRFGVWGSWEGKNVRWITPSPSSSVSD